MAKSKRPKRPKKVMAKIRGKEMECKLNWKGKDPAKKPRATCKPVVAKKKAAKKSGKKSGKKSSKK